MHAPGELESERPASGSELDEAGEPTSVGPAVAVKRPSRSNEAFALVIAGALATGLAVAGPLAMIMLVISTESSADDEIDAASLWPFLLASFTAGVAVGILTALVTVFVLRIAERQNSLSRWGAALVAGSVAGFVTFLLLGLPTLLSPVLPSIAFFFLFTTAFGTQLYPLFVVVAGVVAALVVAWFRRARTDSPSTAPAALLGGSAVTPPRRRSPAGRFAASAVLVALGTLVFNFFWVAQLPSWNVREDCARLGAGGGEFSGIEWSWFPAQTVCDKDGAAIAVVPPWVAVVLGIGLFAALALGVLATVVASRQAADAAPAPARRTVALARAAMALAVVSFASPLWMALINGALSSAWVKPSPERMVYFGFQLGTAALIPLLALTAVVLCLAAARRLREERRIATRSSTLATAALVVAVCTLVTTVGVGLGRMIELQQSIEGQERLDSLPASPWLPLDGSDPNGNSSDGSSSAEAPPAAPPSTAMTPNEARLAMQSVIAETMDAATSGASELRWIDASVASTSTGNDAFPLVDAPGEPVETSCSDGAGVRYDLPATSFAIGTITDTSSEQNDVDVTEANVAAADRIIARWESLGYVEDSGLGGNFELYGTPESAASQLTVRFDFGTVTIATEGLCVAP